MLRAGLIGLPSTGKTTLLHLLTRGAGEAPPTPRRQASQWASRRCPIRVSIG